MIAPAGIRIIAPRFGVIRDARRHQRRRRVQIGVVGGALSAVLGLVAVSAGGFAAGDAGNAAPPAATVRYVGRPPIGYAVTFRYRAPGASSVRIEGEWYFSSSSDTTASTSQGLLPTQWKPGDFPIAWPNGPYGGWPVITMTKERGTGIWAYTTPLPSGLYDYRFVVDCTDATLAAPSSTTCGVHTPTSDVYVPPDPAVTRGPYGWEAPTLPAGRLTEIDNSALIGERALSGMSTIQVYMPPRYEPRRRVPYPTLYVIGSAGDSDPTAGVHGITNILDNLIDHGVIEPIVVVFATFEFSDCNTGGWAGYDAAMVSGVIPVVTGRYDVSTKSSQRAVAGFSCGGTMAGSLLVNDASDFRAFGLLAPLGSVADVQEAHAAAIKRAVVMVGGGLQDPWRSYAASDVARLMGAGARPESDFVDGGHESFVWRALFHDFLRRWAPLTTGRQLTARRA